MDYEQYEDYPTKGERRISKRVKRTKMRVRGRSILTIANINRDRELKAAGRS